MGTVQERIAKPVGIRRTFSCILRLDLLCTVAHHMDGFSFSFLLLHREQQHQSLRQTHTHMCSSRTHVTLPSLRDRNFPVTIAEKRIFFESATLILLLAAVVVVVVVLV